MGSWRLGKEEFGLAWLGLLFMLPYLTYLAMRCIMHRLGVCGRLWFSTGVGGVKVKEKSHGILVLYARGSIWRQLR